MKVAFFHDHKFRRDSSGMHHSPGGLPYSILSRYLEVFDSLVVVAREQDLGVETLGRLTVASGPRVELACVRASQLALLAGSSVRRHVRKVIENTDCAIVRLPSLIGFVAAREAMRARKPWMAEVVACVWDAYQHHGSFQGILGAPPLYFVNRHYVRKARRALYVTQEFLQRRYPCGGTTAGCSDVAIAKAAPAVLERRLERIDGMRARPTLTVGLVGSLDINYKGHDTALRALKLVSLSRPDVQLSFLGGGDTARWRELAAALGVAHAVEFVGTLPSGPPVLDWMDRLDAYVIPSLQEGLPRALVEAMSRALPAVGARTGGIPELIEPRYLHRPRDAAHLARLVLDLIGSADAMREQATANFRKAASYSRDVLDARREHFLRQFRADAEAALGERASAAPARTT